MSAILFLITVAAATGSGLSIARLFPWSSRARASLLPLATAVGLAPMLTGIATIVALRVFPAAMHTVHAAFAIAVLVAGAVPGVRALFQRRAGSVEPGTVGDRRAKIIGGLMAVFALALIVDVAATRLVHNDALEYATVGRVIFEARDLQAYPVMDGTSSSSGFFAPWTHPPLYVSLAYLTYAFEGSAADTTLFRLIAPWCFLATILCVAALGRQVSRNCGALAALICMSIPMLYLGSAAAQIDALPVLGFTLAFIGVTSLEGRPWQQGVALGSLLGLSLWTHSQAILFPALLLPILIVAGSADEPLRSRIARALGVAAIALLAMLVIAAPPYLRNLQVFGAPVSDNPAVFAYPPLGWEDFFKLQRGLAHAQEILAYGVFKGFFAIEIFSLAFWLMLPAVPAALAVLIAKLRTAKSPQTREPAATYLSASLVVVAAYLAGVALSVGLGIDVMIRNERYMLVLAPCLALLGAIALDGSGDAAQKGATRAREVLFGAVAAVLCLQLVALSVYRLHAVAASTSVAAAEGVHDAPMEYLLRRTPPDSLVLALRPADMFYADRRMISYLDPRMLEFYEQSDPERAFQVLHELGIDYVQVPDYTLPPFYNSQLMQVLAQPKYSELVDDDVGYQIYRLRRAALEPSPQQPSAPAVGLRGWQHIESIMLGGSGGIASVELQRESYAPATLAGAWSALLLLRRITVTSLLSESVPLAAAGKCNNGRRPNEYDIVVRASGDGFLNVFAHISGGGASLERKSLGGIPLAEQRGQIAFRRRIIVPGAADHLQLDLIFRPVANIRLLGADLRAVCPL